MTKTHPYAPIDGSKINNSAFQYFLRAQILQPRIDRLKELMYFKDEVANQFIAALSLLASPLAASSSERRNTKVEIPLQHIPCEGLLVGLINMLDLFIVIDALKDAKACLSNDFSMYKRSFSHCRSEISNAEQIALENNLLQPFLASKETFVAALKIAVEKLPRCQEPFVVMANLCVESIENAWYLLPHEKYRFLRVAVYLFFLLDSPHTGASVFSNRRLHKRERYARLFKRTPIVPLYGDMHINLSGVLARCPSWVSHANPADWIVTTKRDHEQMSRTYDITLHMTGLRAQVVEYIATLNALLARVRRVSAYHRRGVLVHP